MNEERRMGSQINTDGHEYRATIDASAATIRYLFVLNGATAFAILAFVPDLILEEPGIAAKFSWPFWLLGAGAGVAALSTLLAYGANYNFLDPSRVEKGLFYVRAMVAAKLASLGLFSCALFFLGFTFANLT